MNNGLFQIKMDFSGQLFANFSGYRLFCGFSGGADSTAALLLAKKYQTDYNYELYAVHFNHHLRGAESDREAENAALLAQKYSIPFRCVDLKINGSENLESAARQARIESWKKLLPERSAVVLGHHAGDRRENLLIRLFRGSNSRGLSSMRAVSEVEGVTFIRPLLRMERKDIEKFLCSNGIGSWAMDSSNSGNEFLRNYLRNSFFPELVKLFPASLKGMDRSLQALEADADFIDSWVKDLQGDRNSINFWQCQHDAVKIRLLRELTGVIPNAELLARLNHELQHTSGELRKIPVNKNISLALRNDTITVAKQHDKTAGFQEFIWEWKKTPVIRAGKWQLTVSYPEKVESCGPECAFFDAGELPEKLETGLLQPGEKMVPFGSDKLTKIKKLRIDRHIPPERMFPVLRSGGNVYWAVMIRNSDLARVSEKTSQIVKFEFSETDI